MLVSVELNGFLIWFIYFLDLLKSRCNYGESYYRGIFKTDFKLEEVKILRPLIREQQNHCVKSVVRIWSYSGPYFPTFGLNNSEYGQILRSE